MLVCIALSVPLQSRLEEGKPGGFRKGLEIILAGWGWRLPVILTDWGLRLEVILTDWGWLVREGLETILAGWGFQVKSRHSLQLPRWGAVNVR